MRSLSCLLLLLFTSAMPARALNGLGEEDDAYFPLAVWVQQPRNAEKYRAIGVNLYVALSGRVNAEALDALDEAGLRIVCHQNEFALSQKDRKTIAAWMHGDEPDNAQAVRGGKKGEWGPPIPPETIVERYKRVKEVDPSRPVLLNLGQGVAWDNWIGRGVRRNKPEDYPLYVKGCDIASFDIYPAGHEHPDVAGKLWYVGRGVERLVKWTGGQKPVWACIETTRIHNLKVEPTPGQVRSEVWMAIVHGAKGIIYFCHQFEPKFIEAGLLARPEMVEGVKKVNAEVARLAPVINSPAVVDGAAVESSNPDVPIAVTCRRHDGATYVFAVSMRSGATKGTFDVAGLTGAGRVEVIGEGRSIECVDGKFVDEFPGGYDVRLYRIGGRG